MNVPRRAGVAFTMLVLTGGLARSATGQWGISLDAQRSAYGGTSTDTSGVAHSSIRPSKTLAFTLRFSRRWGALTTALGARVARSDLVAEAPGVFVGVADEFTFVEFLPEVSWRLTRTSRGATMELYAGPVLGVWKYEDFGRRFVPGGTAGVQGAFPIFERLSLTFRVGGSLMRSVFRAGEVPPEVELHATRRSEISLGLCYGR